MTAFIRLARWSSIATAFLIFIGGLVRVSGAGLGCPDWPRCFGRWLPPLSITDLPSDLDPSLFNVTLAWIEYFNRLVGMTVGLLIAATAVLAIIHYRKEPRILWCTILAGVLTAIQGWQGATVVSSELHPLVVTLHMTLALVIFSLMIYVTVEAGYLRQPKGIAGSLYPASASLWAWLLWIGGIAQVMLGAKVRGTVETLAEQFPLHSTADLLAMTGVWKDLHFIVGLMLAFATWYIGYSLIKLSSEAAPIVKQAVYGLMVLAFAEILIGFVFMFGGLPPLLRLFHVWVGSLYVGLALVLISSLRKGYTELAASGGRFRSAAIGTAVAVVVMGVGAYGVIAQAQTSRRQIPVLDDVPAFSFVDREGRAFTKENLTGKLSVVDFFFTSCRGPCPVMVVKMKELYDFYKHSDRVQFVSFTVDPQTDSLPVLRTYASSHGVTDHRWEFVTSGSADVISKFCEEGFKLSGDLPGMHSTKFVLIDQQGRIRGYYDHDDPNRIKALQAHIRELAGGND